MLKFVYFIFVFFPLHLFSGNFSEEQFAKRIYAHIEIQDPHSAVVEAEQALLLNPNSKILYEAYLLALSKEGSEKFRGQVWQKYRKLFPENAYKREVLEAMAWGTLHSSSNSSSPLIRLLAVIGGFYGQDAEGVEILLKSLKDPNTGVRLAAVEFSSRMRDARLGEEILRLLKEENNWKVRLEAIHAAGEMKLIQAKPVLMELLSNDLKTQEEKAIALNALVTIYGNIEKNELDKLLNSPRAVLRALACQIIEDQDLYSYKEALFVLLKDCHSEVRKAALHSIGILNLLEKGSDDEKKLCFDCLSDSDPQVVITASWLFFSESPDKVSDLLKSYILGKDIELALQATGALVATGQKGSDLMCQLYKQSDNKFIRLNLAIGLIQQGQYSQECCSCLYNCIMTQDEKWMSDDSGFFHVIVPNRVKHDDLIPNYPEAVNQTTRLEILNILAIMKYPKAQEAIRYSLQQKTIGISGLASSLLLTEGDESSIALVENLLDDSDPKIRLQAALVLAMWGGGEKALNTLYKAYNTSDRSIKEKILEGLANIADEGSIPFLVEKLQEPYPSLRIIAAVALLASLNH